MRRIVGAIAGCAALGLAFGTALAQTDSKAARDPAAILAAAKAASGGAAWDTVAVQHTLVALQTGGMNGAAERWTEIATGRSYMHYRLGTMEGALGYDGTVAWSQDVSGKTRIIDVGVETELAVNAAYRDQLAFWFPARHAASISYKGRSSADGAEFDVVAITPKAGREFELWVNAETKMIERLVESEGKATRTEIYTDWQGVHGLKIPFRVRATRGDPKADELVILERIEYDGPLDGMTFTRPD